MAKKTKKIGSVYDYPDTINVVLRKDGAIEVSLDSTWSMVLNYFSAKELAEYLKMATEEIERPEHPVVKALDRLYIARAYLRRAQTLLTDYYYDTFDKRIDELLHIVGGILTPLESVIAALESFEVEEGETDG